MQHSSQDLTPENSVCSSSLDFPRPAPALGSAPSVRAASWDASVAPQGLNPLSVLHSKVSRALLSEPTPGPAPEPLPCTISSELFIQQLLHRVVGAGQRCRMERRPLAGSPLNHGEQMYKSSWAEPTPAPAQLLLPCSAQKPAERLPEREVGGARDSKVTPRSMGTVPAVTPGRDSITAVPPDPTLVPFQPPAEPHLSSTPGEAKSQHFIYHGKFTNTRSLQTRHKTQNCSDVLKLKIT